MNEQIPTLNYAPQVSMLRRRAIRHAALCVVIVALVAAGVRWGRSTCEQARLLYWQGKCLRYSAPADQVVYEQDPTGASPLLRAGVPYAMIAGGSGGPLGFPAVGLTPDCATRYVALCTPPARMSGAILFMHERATPAGTRCLVIVTSDFAGNSDPHFIAGYDVMPTVIRPATWRAAAIPATTGYAIDVISGIRPTPMHLRVFAGQPDPSDPSHFTIRYELDGHARTVDGFVRDATPTLVMVEFRERRN